MRAWFACALLAAGVALAQAPQKSLDTTAAERPWAKGVPEERQRQALELFKQGNGMLKESLFPAAAAKYREALALWDHPAIHYNLALALVNLDQPEQTLEHLDAALKYGAAPLDLDKFEQAQRYKTLVEKQLAGVDIRCDMEGATVKLDGKLLFTAPGRYTGKVRAGPHSIVASKEGYLTNELSLPLPAGQTKVFELNLLTTDDLTEYKRLWPAQTPWIVVGAGVAVGLIGLGLHFWGKGTYSTYDQQVTACATQTPTAGGCQLTPAIASVKQRGDTLQALGITGYAVGGAAVAVGAVLLYLNRLQPYRIQVGVGGAHASVLPSLGPSGGGATFTLDF